LAAVCADQNIGVIPYSPLAAGFATGKYTRENRDPDTTRRSGGLVQRLVNNEQAYEVLDVLTELAQAHSVPIAQIALAWQLAKPNLTAPIIGARTVEQLHELLGACEVSLSAQDISRLDDASKGF
jgi:aryl-alcohol dehydrogenase-like predicted oxidoreductase